jgi:DNA-binding CsgD family transcriptional regulator
MIVVGDRRIDGPVEQTILEQTYGLTPAEARLALRLATGGALADHARENRVSIHTVRTQLQAVYLKLGVNRQGALVAMLQRLLPPVKPAG